MRLDEHGEFCAVMGPGLQAAPALDRCLQIVQALVKPGLRDRWRQIADQGCATSALGNGAFRRIVRRVEVDVGQVVDQPIWPAIARQPALLARHEFQRAVGAKVQHGVGCKVFAQVAVEG